MDPESANDVRVTIPLDEARTALAEQRVALESIRTRATALLGVVAAAGVLGSPHLSGLRLTAAIVLLALVLCVVAFIFWPREFRTTFSARTLTGDDWSGLPPDDFLTRFASCLDYRADANEKTLRALHAAFIGGIVLSAALAVVLILSIP